MPIYFDENIDFLKREKICAELWNSIVYPEFDSIFKKLKESSEFDSLDKNSEAEKMLQRSMIGRKAGMIWNKKFEHFRFYKNYIYYLELNGPQPSLLFERYSVENFCKQVDRMRNDLQNLYKRKELLETIIGISFLIGWAVFIIYLLMK